MAYLEYLEWQPLSEWGIAVVIKLLNTSVLLPFKSEWQCRAHHSSAILEWNAIQAAPCSRFSKRKEAESHHGIKL